MANEDFRGSLVSLAQSMMSQVNRDVEPRINTLESTMNSRLREFVRMNPPTLLGSKVGDDTQDFWDEVYTWIYGVDF